MAETPSSQVTITFGSTSQVVRRAGPMMDGSFLESLPASGGKRSEGSIRGRRRDGNKSHLISDEVAAKGKRIGKDDLRFKTMQKNMSCQAQTNDRLNGMDLREKLSRAVKHEETNVDLRKPRLETKEINPWSQIPSRSTEVLPRMDLTRSYYAWSLLQLKQRYPAGIPGSTGIFPPQMNVEKLQKRPIIQKYDNVRSAPVTTNNIFDPPGCISTTPFMTKSTLLNGCAKPVAPMQAHLQPLGSIVQKKPCIGDEQPTVGSLLQSLGLGKYAIYF